MRSFYLSHRRLLGRLACLLASLGVGAVARAELIYQEDFAGPAASALKGRTPTLRAGVLGGDVQARWIGPDAAGPNRIGADGGLGMQVKFAVGASAFLPFRPEVGRVYKLTVSGIHVPIGDWVGAGFSTTAAPKGDGRFRDAGTVFWGLVRGEGATLNDQTFSGPEIAGVENAATLSASVITILLDTTSAKLWDVRWFLDGREVRRGKFARQPITHAGFGFNASATGVAGTSEVGGFVLEGWSPEADTDGDGLPDQWEQTHFFANAGDSLAATLAHYDGKADPDGDGFNNFEEFVGGSAPRWVRSNPLDTNGDGLPDAWQRHYFGSIEAAAATSDSDFDQDGFTNQQEAAARSNPRDPLSKPAGVVAPPVAATIKAAPPVATLAPATPVGVVFDAARTGTDVFLAWVLPPGRVGRIELFRNDRAEAAGRLPLATVPSPTSVFLDRVPDANTIYWYWLVITGADGKPVEFGPFSTVTSKVWQP